PISLHQKCIEHLKIFLLIGGMPEVVASYIENGSLLECQQILDDLTKTFYDDFAKYKERTSVSQLREVFNAVIQQAGKKFVFSNIQGINQLQVKKGVEMLEMAGLIYPITHTSANGLPLGAEINNKHKKFMLFDCGIYQRYLQLNIAQILSADSFDAINKGAIAELFVATELKKSTPANNSSELYYWRREQQGSQAEVDFVVQDGEDIVPIEVKAGLKGSMQSMFLFLKEKNKKYGIRTSLENFGKFDNIKIYPLYAIACAAGGAS
ncbi:MAG: DUF4143 domain-containing protein, partial [Bacteroidales bacterium]|nr:DUF4143 domain-containing protein [Bacteroidales bacterium]